MMMMVVTVAWGLNRGASGGGERGDTAFGVHTFRGYKGCEDAIGPGNPEA